MSAVSHGTLINVLTGPAVPPQGVPLPAGALVAPFVVHTDVTTASIRLITLVYIWKKESKLWDVKVIEF